MDLADYTNPFAQVVDRIPDPTEDGAFLSQYEIGRYVYEDSEGLKNGMLYFYDVTAYSCWVDSTGYQEMSSQPAAVEVEGVRPRWEAVPDSVDWKSKVMVVPNPWRGGAEWDLTPSDRDPTGTKIAFINLPPTVSTIRIYTLAGDLVQVAEHDGGNGDGTYFWNMITRNGQNVTSGIYLYSVEHPGGICRGRFVIIR